MNNLVTPGSTCRLSTNKTSTVWEIQTVNTHDGTVHLSKLGGDGFVNKSASIDSLIDLTEQVLPVGLYTVLSIKEDLRYRCDALKDKARFINNADDARERAYQLLHTADRLKDANQKYWEGIETHYPHLDTRKK